MPLRLNPTFRDALAEAIPPARRHLGVQRAAPLVAEICAGAGMDWVLIDMEHSPNGLESVLAQLHAVVGLPRHARRARADRRRRDDQAGARPRRAEHPRADGLVRRRGAGGRRGRPLPAARHAAASARPSRDRRAGTASTTTSPTPTTTCRCSSRSRPRPASTPPPRSPRSTASTASSSARRDLAASMGLLGEQTHPDVVDAVRRDVRRRPRRRQAGRRERLRPGRRAGATSTPARRSCSSEPTSRCSPAAPRRSPRGSSRLGPVRRRRPNPPLVLD